MNRCANRSHWTSNSFSNSSLLCPERFRSSDMVIVEEDAHRIEQRLDDAQTRLRLLSINTKSSVKELKKMFGTVQKKSRSNSQLKARSSHCRPHPDSHVQAIRHHLHLLQQQMQVQNQDPNWNHFYDSTQQKSIEPMQDIHNVTVNKGYDFKVRELQQKHQQDVKELLRTIEQLRAKVRQLEDSIAEQGKTHREELREIKIHYESEYLQKQEELMKEIEILEQELGVQKQTESDALRKQLDRINEDNTTLKERAKIQRALKVESINKCKELDAEIKIIRANNSQFLAQINDLKSSLESSAKQTLCICQTILYATQILNRISNNELLATVVMIKEELNIKKPTIKGLINTLKEKYSLECYDLTGRSTLRQKQDQNRFRKFINGDDRENPNDRETEGRRLPTARQQVQQQATTPFLDDLTQIAPTQNTQLYMMLLTQAAQLEQMILFRSCQ